MRRPLTCVYQQASGLLCLLASTALLAFCLEGCASSGARLSNDALHAGNWAEAARLLTAESQADPNNAEIHARLGEAQFRLGRYDQAKDSFHRTLELNPRLSAAHLYLGYIAEARDEMDSALEEYQRYVDLNPRAQQSKAVARRVETMRLQLSDAAAQRAMVDEERQSPAMYTDSSIAVIDFRADYLPDSLRALSKGLASMTAGDLAKVGRLRVVDRLKTGRLLSELGVPSETAFDTSAAPRYGKLLGAARVLGGELSMVGDDRLSITPALVSSNSGDVVLPSNQAGELRQFFRLQKQLVFDVVDRLGIELTDVERDSIGLVATQSLPAFLAYSRGLDLRERGLYGDARKQFDLALRFDPTFAEAGVQVQQMSYFGNSDLSEPPTLESFAGRTMQPTEWGQMRGTATAMHLERLLNNTGLVRTIGAPQAPMGDWPYTPPVNTEEPAAEIIIHGRFD